MSTRKQLVALMFLLMCGLQLGCGRKIVLTAKLPSDYCFDSKMSQPILFEESDEGGGQVEQ